LQKKIKVKSKGAQDQSRRGINATPPHWAPPKMEGKTREEGEFVRDKSHNLIVIGIENSRGRSARDIGVRVYERGFLFVSVAAIIMSNSVTNSHLQVAFSAIGNLDLSTGQFIFSLSLSLFQKTIFAFPPVLRIQG